MFNWLLVSGLVLGLCTYNSQCEPQTTAQLLSQLPRNSKVTSCPPSWIQPLLLPCRCSPQVPSQLHCTGYSVIDAYLSLMNFRLQFALKYHQAMGQTNKQAQLVQSLNQFDTLVVANTSLTKLDSPVFRLFPIQNVVLDSDQLLRQVHLVDTFGTRNTDQKIVQLNNLIIVNMQNVSIEE